MHLAIPVEYVASPDFLDRDVVGIGEELGSAKRDVLTAKRDATERVYIQTLKRPNTWLLSLRRQVCVAVLVQRFTCGDRRVVVPGQKLARNHFVNADLFEPEINSLLELALDRFLANDGNYDTRRRSVLLTHFERCLHVADLPVPPNLRRLCHATARRTKLGVKLRIGGVHRKLNQIDIGFNESFKLFATRRSWAKHAAVCIHPNARATFFRVLDHFHHVRVQHRLTAAGATHPRAILATLASNALPEFYRKQIAVTLTVELAYFGIPIRVGTHRAAEVAGIDDGHHHHQWKFFGGFPALRVRLCRLAHKLKVISYRIRHDLHVHPEKS